MTNHRVTCGVLQRLYALEDCVTSNCTENPSLPLLQHLVLWRTPLSIVFKKGVEKVKHSKIFKKGNPLCVQWQARHPKYHSDRRRENTWKMCATRVRFMARFTAQRFDMSSIHHILDELLYVSAQTSTWSSLCATRCCGRVLGACTPFLCEGTLTRF